MTVVACFGVYIAFVRMSGMDFVGVSGMGSVVVAKVAGGQSGDEYGKTDEHDDPFPSEVPFAMAVSIGMCLLMLMYDIAVMAVCLRSAFFMVMLRAS